MSNLDPNNKLNDLYQARKQQFKAPKSAQFTTKNVTAKNVTPFWKSFSFYSSVCAFSLALVVVLPMMDSAFYPEPLLEIQSDSMMEQTNQNPQGFLQHLDESESFNATPMFSAPMAESISIQKQSKSMEIKSKTYLELSEKKKIDPCKQKKLLAAQRIKDHNTIADRSTSTHTEIDCP